MSAISFLNATVVGQFFGFVGMGSLIDSILPAHHKKLIAHYVFGLAGHSLKEFEASVINAMIEILCRDDDIDKLSQRKVVYYSLIFNTIFWIFAYLYLLVKEYRIDAFILGPITALMTSVISIPLDYYSIYITKKIFYYRPYAFWWLPILVLADIVLSYLPQLILLSILLLVPILIGEQPFVLGLIIAGGAANALGSSLMNLVQVVIVVMGLLIRGIALLAARFGLKPGVGWLESAPVTACFLAAATLITLGEQLLL